MSLNRFFLLSLGTTALTITACAPIGATQWMGRGYKYQDDTPLSSPAPSSPWLDEAVIHDTEKMATNNAAWQGSVYELVDALSPFLPTDGTPLTLTTVAPITAHDTALDHYLRQSLIQKGYNLTTTAGGGTTLTYDATGPNKDGNYMLSASLSDSAKKPLGNASVSAVLPYEKADYGRILGYSAFPIQGETFTPTKVYDRQ